MLFQFTQTTAIIDVLNIISRWDYEHWSICGIDVYNTGHLCNCGHFNKFFLVLLNL